MNAVPGGLSDAKVADKTVQKLIDQVKDAVHAKTRQNYVEYKAVKYKTQVVAGTNYFVKICVGGDACIHVRIFEGLPVDGGKIELAGVQEGKTLEDAIEYF